MNTKKILIIIKTVILCFIINFINPAFPVNEKDKKNNLEQKEKINLEKEKKISFYYSKDDDTMYILTDKNIYTQQKKEIKCILNLNTLKVQSIKKILTNKDIIVIYTKDKQLIVIDKMDKEIKWIKNFKENSLATPLITNDKLFIDLNGYLIFALNNEDGEEIWRYFNKIENFYIHTNAKIIQSNKYMHYIFANKKIITLKKNTGEKILARSIDSSKIKFDAKNKKIYITNVKVNNNILYICYNDGNFLVLDAIFGSVLWKKTKRNYNNFIIYKNQLIITKKNGHITSLNKTNGKKIWTNAILKNKLLTKPTMLNIKKIIMTHNENEIYFFKKNGKFFKKINMDKNKIIDKIFLNKKETHLFITHKDKTYTRIKI